MNPAILIAVVFAVQGTEAEPGNLPIPVLIASLYVFVLAAFLGYQVISRVPPLLHTPLMSATNAISGISLIGSIVIAGEHANTLSTVLGTIAVTSAMINVTGGFLITDRMLKMFRKKDTVKAEEKK
ncbi:MAG TPA: NAD(P) transhydrogenase subunit alpha [Candidatus Solibacter sp.]|jgi:NAD(P) transhydrogenase subunit alpha|nr:NAD(P) transhydrogenase subunit alpha [Candidatus Solibacter sp.]